MASASKIQAIIKKRGGKYHLVSHKGKTLGVHSTREGALKQEQAIEIAKHARQLVDNISCFLAEQERDDHGRFAGPGGSGGRDYKNHDQNKDRAATSSRVAHAEGHKYAHTNAAVEHTIAAGTAPSKEEATYHLEQAAMHRDMAAEKGRVKLDNTEHASRRAQEATSAARDIKKAGGNAHSLEAAHQRAEVMHNRAAHVNLASGRIEMMKEHFKKADSHLRAHEKIQKQRGVYRKP